MEKMKNLAITGATLALLTIGVVVGSQKGIDSKTANTLLSEVESLTNCEAIDTYANDGHCVHNSQNIYFCATPGFLQKKNCKMN